MEWGRRNTADADLIFGMAEMAEMTEMLRALNSLISCCWLCAREAPTTSFPIVVVILLCDLWFLIGREQ